MYTNLRKEGKCQKKSSQRSGTSVLHLVEDSTDCDDGDLVLVYEQLYEF